MKEKEKKCTKELFELIKKLPVEDQKKLLYVGQGILFAYENNAKIG